MKNTRREFILKSTMGAGLLAGGLSSCQPKPDGSDQDLNERYQKLDEVYVYKSNYKLQNLALWVPMASIEFAILDMLGKIANSYRD